MHLDGHEENGERSNLAYGCRSCNQKLSHAFKQAGIGRTTNQYNPASGRVPTYEQYKWGVYNHVKGEHDAGGAIIHATPKRKRIEYAGLIAAETAPQKRETFAQRRRDFEDRYNPTRENLFEGFGSKSKHYTRSGSGKFKDVSEYESVKAAKKASADEAREDERKRAAERKRADQLNRKYLRKLAADKREQARADREAEREAKRLDPKIVGRHGGYAISRDADGNFFSSLDPSSWYDSKRDVVRAINEYRQGRRNPAGVHVVKTPHGGYVVRWKEGGKTRESQDVFTTQKDAESEALHIQRTRRGVNPAKFDRCVKEVQARGTGVNAYAVCTAAGTRNPAKRKRKWEENIVLYSGPDAEQAQDYLRRAIAAGSYMGLQKFKSKGEWYVTAESIRGASRFNPAGASADVFEEFHGHPPSEVVTVSKEIHFHSNLAALGELEFLKVWGIDGRGHTIEGFDGAILCTNEAKNQMFIEGGDQTVNLGDYGIKREHETETLGKILELGYYTNKDHLGDEGGEAVYVHKLRYTNKDGRHVIVKPSRYPDLVYDVRNESLLISGGSYYIRAEGIDV